MRCASCESAVFVVNGVMGVEVTTRRLWSRAEELDIARLIFVNMLDRERADFFRALESSRTPSARTSWRPRSRSAPSTTSAGSWTSSTCRPTGTPRTGTSSEIEIPDDLPGSQEFREKLMDEICEVSDTLMERYLEGEEIAHDEIVTALKDGTNHGDIFPVTCGAATRALATTGSWTRSSRTCPRR